MFVSDNGIRKSISFIFYFAGSLFVVIVTIAFSQTIYEPCMMLWEPLDIGRHPSWIQAEYIIDFQNKLTFHADTVYC